MPATRVAALLLLGGLAACDGTDASSPPKLPTRGCDVNQDCPAALTCIEGGCVASDGPAWSFGLRVRPGSNTAHATVDVLDTLAFPAGPVRRLGAVHIPIRRTITGRARVGDRDIRVDVTATALEGIPGQPLRFSAETAESDAFVLDLAPAWPKQDTGGRAVPFQLRVSPANDAFPPFEPAASRLEPTLALTLPGDPLRRLEGRILVSEANPTPLRNVALRAVDAAGRLVSTTAISDETGAFSLALWPGGADEVVLRANSTLPESPLPTVQRTVRVSEGPATVFVGDVGSTFTLSGEVVAEGDQTPAETRVVFHAAVGNGHYTTSAVTDAEGHFEVTLYEGVYVIDVVPPPPFRLARLERALAAGDAPIQVAARARVRVDGCLRDVGGEPVEGATVTTRLISAAYGDPRLESKGPSTVPDRVVTSEASNESGQFTLSLDGGEHVLTVEPPVERGLPTIQVPTERVSPGTGSVDLGRNGCIVIPPGAVVTADLIGEDSAPVAGAIVEAWKLVDGGAVRVGQATSGADGHVVLILPNR